MLYFQLLQRGVQVLLESPRSYQLLFLLGVYMGFMAAVFACSILVIQTAPLTPHRGGQGGGTDLANPLPPLRLRNPDGASAHRLQGQPGLEQP